MSDRLDALWKFYDEHASQARRHEEHRERMTSLVIVLAGALVALIGQSRFAFYSLPAAATIVLLGIYGWLFARKHYERNQLHLSTLRELRTEIDSELAHGDPQGRGESRSLTALRNAADKRHYDEFPPPKGGFQGNARSWIARRRLHHFWEGLHIGVIIVGAILLGIIVFQPGGLAEKKPIEVRVIQ
jgi:hypothetical protein